jgi:hypothetical protein
LRVAPLLVVARFLVAALRDFVEAGIVRGSMFDAYGRAPAADK